MVFDTGPAFLSDGATSPIWSWSGGLRSRSVPGALRGGRAAVSDPVPSAAPCPQRRPASPPPDRRMINERCWPPQSATSHPPVHRATAFPPNSAAAPPPPRGRPMAAPQSPQAARPIYYCCRPCRLEFHPLDCAPGAATPIGRVTSSFFTPSMSTWSGGGGAARRDLVVPTWRWCWWLKCGTVAGAGAGAAEWCRVAAGAATEKTNAEQIAISRPVVIRGRYCFCL